MYLSCVSAPERRILWSTSICWCPCSGKSNSSITSYLKDFWWRTTKLTCLLSQLLSSAVSAYPRSATTILPAGIGMGLAILLSCPFPSLICTYSGSRVLKSKSVCSLTAPFVCVYLAQSYRERQSVMVVESKSLTGCLKRNLRLCSMPCCPKWLSKA